MLLDCVAFLSPTNSSTVLTNYNRLQYGRFGFHVCVHVYRLFKLQEAIIYYSLVGKFLNFIIMYSIIEIILLRLLLWVWKRTARGISMKKFE